MIKKLLLKRGFTLKSAARLENKKNSQWRSSDINARHSGFTLIELMVVISIIGILAAIGSISYFDAQARSRDAKRKADLKEIQTALELYHEDKGAYPIVSTWRSYCNYWDGNKDTTGANGYVPDLAPQYIKVLPLDPYRKTDKGTILNSKANASSDWTFCYIYYSNGIDYKIAAHCAVEGKSISASDAFFKGAYNWFCDNASAQTSYSMALFTDGAVNW